MFEQQICVRAFRASSFSNKARKSSKLDISTNPDEKKPIYEILEEYADDHDVWVNDFLAAWQRMAEIGYTKKRKGRGKKTKSTLKIAAQNAWFGYYKAKDLHEAEGMEMPGTKPLFCPLLLLIRNNTLLFQITLS